MENKLGAVAWALNATTARATSTIALDAAVAAVTTCQPVPLLVYLVLKRQRLSLRTSLSASLRYLVSFGRRLNTWRWRFCPQVSETIGLNF